MKDSIYELKIYEDEKLFLLEPLNPGILEPYKRL